MKRGRERRSAGGGSSVDRKDAACTPGCVPCKEPEITTTREERVLLRVSIVMSVLARGSGGVEILT